MARTQKLCNDLERMIASFILVVRLDVSTAGITTTLGSHPQGFSQVSCNPNKRDPCLPTLHALCTFICSQLPMAYLLYIPHDSTLFHLHVRGIFYELS